MPIRPYLGESAVKLSHPSIQYNGWLNLLLQWFAMFKIWKPFYSLIQVMGKLFSINSTFAFEKFSFCSKYELIKEVKHWLKIPFGSDNLLLRVNECSFKLKPVATHAKCWESNYSLVFMVAFILKWEFLNWNKWLSCGYCYFKSQATFKNNNKPMMASLCPQWICVSLEYHLHEINFIVLR